MSSDNTPIRTGDLVISLAGRDRGSLLLVLSAEGGRLTLADGRRRPYGRPKRKNRRHVALVERAPFGAAPPTDRALRRAIRAHEEHTS